MFRIWDLARGSVYSTPSFGYYGVAGFGLHAVIEEGLESFGVGPYTVGDICNILFLLSDNNVFEWISD